MTRQLLRPGFKLSEYSNGGQCQVRFMSGVVYAATFVTALVTTVLYNPENLFGSNDFVTTPIVNFQTRELSTNCVTLVLLFDEVNFPTKASRSASDLRVFMPNIRVSRFNSTGGLLSTEVVSQQVDLFPNVTLSWSGDVDICRSFMGPFFDQYVNTVQACGDFCGGTTLSVPDPVFTQLPNIGQRQGRTVEAGTRNAIPIDFEQGFFDVYVEDLGFIISDSVFSGFTFATPPDKESFLSSACTATTFADTNLANLPPFSCSQELFRGWLEVLALATSNAGLVFAGAVVVLAAFIDHPLESGPDLVKIANE